jgi:hypothetical protein
MTPQRLPRGLALVLILLAVLAVLHGPALAKKARELTVQVREAAVREAPSFLSPVLARLGYTVRARVVKEEGEWVKVEVPGEKASGWMHSSALVEQRIYLQAPDKKTAKKLTASKKETALAGRSFEGRVERHYRDKNRNLETGYIALERALAALEPTAPEEVESFRLEGGLAPLQGGEAGQ